MDHAEAGASVKGPARGWAAACALLVVGGALMAIRFGPREPTPAAVGDAVSAVWICPHGGGPDWEASVAVANPGRSQVHVRMRSIGKTGAVALAAFDVPAGAQVVQATEAPDRGSATVVEVFGGWAGVGWRIRAGGEERGLGAEPCSPVAGPLWHVPGLSTLEGESAFVVIANPFSTTAVIDVVIFAPDAPPVRDPAWTELAIGADSSVALPLSAKVPGKASVLAVVTARAGRVGVAGLGVSETGGVRSVLGGALAATWLLPTGQGSGQSSLTVGVPGDRGVRFGAILRSEAEPQVVGGLVEVRQGPLSVGVFPVITPGPAAVDVTAQGQIAAALVSEGRRADDAATTGASTASADWLVLPTALEEPWHPALVLSNPGETDVQVELRSIPASGGESRTVTLTVPAGLVASAPRDFMMAVGDATVLVRASGPVVAAGVSTSSGRDGLALYAGSTGVPIPAWVLGVG